MLAVLAVVCLLQGAVGSVMPRAEEPEPAEEEIRVLEEIVEGESKENTENVESIESEKNAESVKNTESAERTESVENAESVKSAGSITEQASGSVSSNDAEELSAEGGSDTVYKFASSSGKFYINTVNTLTGARQSHTINIAVDKKIDMGSSNQEAKYTMTSSGNWQKIGISASKYIMGAISESGEKSDSKFVLYNMITVPKPAGYIVSSYNIADFLDGNSNPYGVSASLRWNYENAGVAYGTVATGKYFYMSMLNKYAPQLQTNDMRYNNTYPAAANLKLMVLTNSRSTGLKWSQSKKDIKNMTITINYKPASYTVSYQSNGGNGLANTAAVYDKAFTLPTPVRSGYTFTGWSGAGLNARTGNVSNLTTSDGATVTLSAGWKANPYTVKYDSAGGNAVSNTTAVYDTAFTLPTPVRSGYIFTGWSGSGLTNQVGTVRNLTAQSGGVISLKAGWKPITYTLKLTSDGGGEYKDTILSYGQSMKLPTPEKENFVFLGWSGGGLVRKTGEVSNLTVADHSVVELTAEWAPRESEQPQTKEPDPQPSEPVTEEENKPGEDDEEEDGEDADKKIIHQYYNEYGLSQEQAKALLDALTQGSEARIRIENTEFTFSKNEDGTITIKLAGVSSGGKVVIPNEVTIGETTYPITAIEKECFYKNQQIREIVMGNHVASIGEKAFAGCTNLEQVALNEGLKTIGNSAFEGCTKLKSLTLNRELLSIGNKAFYGCSGLKSLFLPKKLLKIGNSAFAGCSRLKKITSARGAELMKLGSSVFARDKALVSVSLPKGLTMIPSKAFMGCGKLKKITLPSGIQKIGSQAFYNCGRLEKVSIKSKHLTSVGKKAFVKCKKKIRFHVPKGKTRQYAKLMKGKY